MNDQISYTPDEIKWAEVMRNLKPGDAPIVRPDTELNTANSTRGRETATTGASFNIRRDKVSKQIFVTCLSRPLFHSTHGVTVFAKYHGVNAKPSDEDDIHELLVYTGKESLHLHKKDGTCSRQYADFSEFLDNWTIVKQ